MKNEMDEPDYLQKAVWPDGSYQFRLQSCSLQKSRSGNRMVVVEHFCTEGDKEGQVLREYKMLNTDTATGFFMMWVENLGYEVPKKSTDLEKFLETIQSDAPCYMSEVRTRNGLTDTYINPAQEDDEGEMDEDWDSARDMLQRGEEYEPDEDVHKVGMVQGVINGMKTGLKIFGTLMVIGMFWLFCKDSPTSDSDYGPPITDGVPSGPPESEQDLSWPPIKSRSITVESKSQLQKPKTSKRKTTKSRPARRVRVPRTCTKCDGAGLLSCNHCNGSGTTSAQFGEIVTCWKCNGIRTIKCHICHGRGTR